MTRPPAPTRPGIETRENSTPENDVTTTALTPGTPAPDFTLPDSTGTTHTLSDYRGGRIILYFYPAASTPGCTTQACDFRDNLGSLAAAGYTVLGVSKDEADALEKFRTEEHLTFPLLSDPGLDVHKAYGAWGEKSLYGKPYVGTLRSTFVIDENGLIEQALYNVKATGHVAMMRKRLGIV